MRRVILSLPERVTADDSLYGVRVLGDELPDGKWVPCIEFESGRGIRLETCPALVLETTEALKSWVERLDRSYLLDALTRASRGRIRKTRRQSGR